MTTAALTNALTNALAAAATWSAKTWTPARVAVVLAAYAERGFSDYATAVDALGTAARTAGFRRAAGGTAYAVIPTGHDDDVGYLALTEPEAEACSISTVAQVAARTVAARQAANEERAFVKGMDL